MEDSVWYFVLAQNVWSKWNKVYWTELRKSKMKIGNCLLKLDHHPAIKDEKKWMSMTEKYKNNH